MRFNAHEQSHKIFFMTNQYKKSKQNGELLTF